MKIGWQLTKLLRKLSGLLFLAHPAGGKPSIQLQKVELSSLVYAHENNI